MHVIEIFLPLYDNEGRRLPTEQFAKLREELLDRFGGLTAFSRVPAEGLWEPEDGKRKRDDIVIFEVMAEEVDQRWWTALRARLERDLAQEEIMIRASEARRL